MNESTESTEAAPPVAGVPPEPPFATECDLVMKGGITSGIVYPLAITERKVKTASFLVHLAVHLTYHLGQIDYHRRLLTSDPKPVENVSVRELPEGR